MDLKYILFSSEEGIGRIQFNRPDKLNAVNSEVLMDLERVLDQYYEDEGIRVVILTGNEKAFVAGADVKDMSTGDIRFAYSLTELTLRVQEKYSACKHQASSLCGRHD